MSVNTSDIALAAFLKAKGVRYLGCTLDTSNKGVFSFENSPHVADYNQGLGSVEPASFHEAIKFFSMVVRRLKEQR